MPKGQEGWLKGGTGRALCEVRKYRPLRQDGWQGSEDNMLIDSYLGENNKVAG